MKSNISKVVMWFVTTVAIMFGLLITKDIDVLAAFCFPVAVEVLTRLSED